MTATRSSHSFSIAAFQVGFALGGLSLHVASAQGVFGLKPSVTQIGSALVDMQKNVDELQKNMGTIKQAKDQLSSLSPATGEAMKKEGESLKQMIPRALVNSGTSALSVVRKPRRRPSADHHDLHWGFSDLVYYVR